MQIKKINFPAAPGFYRAKSINVERYVTSYSSNDASGSEGDFRGKLWISIKTSRWNDDNVGDVKEEQTRMFL